jgi:hypothetical protein
VFVSSVSVFLPCPFSDFSSYPRHFGDGGICGTVSELRDGVEHKFSDLPRDEVCLVSGSYFLRFLSAGQVAGWRKTILIFIRSTGPRPLVLNRAGLASAAAIEPDCWAGDCWVGVVFVDLGSTALGFIYLGSCAATELRNSGMSLTWFRAESSGRYVQSPKDVATRLSNWEAMSSSCSAPSHVRYSGTKKKPWGWKSSWS